jgi:Pregnancy-associated plasma protein-A
VRLFKGAATTVLALTIAGLPAAVATPAVASSTGAHAAALVPCVTDIAARMQGEDTPVPKWRQHSDTSTVTAEDLEALPAAETRRAYVNREVRPRLAARVNIPVYAHVIKGKHRGELNPAGPRRVAGLIATLNRGMAGGQSEFSTPLRYRFFLKKIDYTKRDGWYHAYLFGPRDQKAKRALHRGNARSLNLYINGGGPTGVPVLGWARFPWQYRSTPLLDSVTVNVAAMRGGRASGYNLGDTVLHEVGHWLGLYHTFQGGCGPQGDLVADTPAEDEPSFECEGRRDTCPADPGFDPVRNFMDYSLDLCMNRFSAGQVQRVDAAFVKWRQ